MEKEAVHLLVDRKQKDNKGPRRRLPHGSALNGLLLPAVSHLLKYSETLEIAPLAGDQGSSFQAFLGHAQILIGSEQGKPSWCGKEK